MTRLPLDIYDNYPREMRKYLANYGWHFNKKACAFATSLMKIKSTETGKTENIEPLTKDEVDTILKRNSVVLEQNVGYDYVFVANMCKADYFGSSIPDEQHLAIYIKDTIEDIDAADGVTMRRWYATMVANGIVIEWDEFL